MRVIIAGGGTGGHVIPALAIAQELRSRYDAEVLFVGTAARHRDPAGSCRRLSSCELITVGALNRVDLATRAEDAARSAARAHAQSARLIREFRPDVMIGVGGYASGPAMLAGAHACSVPMMAFEPNVVPGFANRMVAPMVQAAAVHFAATCDYFRNCHGHRCSGAARVLQRAAASGGRTVPRCWSSAAARERTPSTWRCSRRCRSLARSVPGIHIIHQTGEKDYESAQAAYLQAHDLRRGLAASSTTCPGRLRAPTCWSAAPAPARSPKSPPPASRPSSFRCPPRPTTISATMPRSWPMPERARLLPQAELTADRLVSEVAIAVARPRPLWQGWRTPPAHSPIPTPPREIAAMAARLAGDRRAPRAAM